MRCPVAITVRPAITASRSSPATRTMATTTAQLLLPDGLAGLPSTVADLVDTLAQVAAALQLSDTRPAALAAAALQAATDAQAAQDAEVRTGCCRVNCNAVLSSVSCNHVRHAHAESSKPSSKADRQCYDTHSPPAFPTSPQNAASPQKSTGGGI